MIYSGSPMQFAINLLLMNGLQMSLMNFFQSRDSGLINFGTAAMTSMNSFTMAAR